MIKTMKIWAISQEFAEEDLPVPEQQTVEQEPEQRADGIINVKGIIVSDGASAYPDIVSVDDLNAQVDAAVANPKVGRIVFVFGTPGGEAARINDFARKLRGLSKPTVAFVESRALSAGYWLAAACDKIVAAETSEVGSIGAVVTYRRSGNDREYVTFKSRVSPHKNDPPESKTGGEEIQKRIDATGMTFVKSVAENRGVSEEYVLTKFGQGGIIDAEDALSVGMVDEIGMLENITKDRKMTLDEFRAENPGVIEEIEARAINEERKRVAGIMSAAAVEDGVIKAVSGNISIGEFAVAALSQLREHVKAEEAKPVPEKRHVDIEPVVVVPVKAAAAHEPVDKVKAEWDGSADVRREFFNDYESFKAYTAASDAGLVKII
jgi:ClpP class serine protease